jgi:hypothetical protein
MRPRIFYFINFLLLILLVAVLSACNSDGPVAPGGNNMAPEWVSTVGIVSVVAGESAVTVYWGEAIDLQDPPVEYLVYKDVDDNPFDQIPVVRDTNEPYTFTGLEMGTDYWFGVRVRDSARPPHADDNNKVLEAMPRSNDRTPPVWDDMVGVVSVVPGDMQVTVYFGTATDIDSPPVKYLIYMDTDDSPWDQPPVERDTNDPYTFINLTNDIPYWFGVRCEDSAIPPNIDDNTIVISATSRSGWARTWGGFSSDKGYGVAVDDSGNVYVTGSFTGEVDFNPDPTAEDIHSPNGYYIDSDNFLSKFDSSGTFVWARTWGAKGDNESYGVGVDGTGNIYVTGAFEGNSVDFNPDPNAVDLHAPVGYYDAFLSKFDPSGTFVWARTWGGSSMEESRGVAADRSGNIYVTGAFDGASVDFNPDPIADDIHSSNGLSDIFISKFDSLGTFVWARTWGGDDDDEGYGVAVDVSGKVNLTGYFYGALVDFNPDPASDDRHSSNGYYDAFLSNFDSSGNFMWARTWGGWGLDEGLGVAVDGSGNAYVTGRFQGNSIDFDPDPTLVDPHSSSGQYDIFLSKFDSYGIFAWARNWGGDSTSEGDSGYGVAADRFGDVYVTGSVYGDNGTIVDFNPDPTAADPHSLMGNDEVFLSKFDSFGTFVWTRTVGGGGDDVAYSVAVDESGPVYVTGYFGATFVDFNPDPIEIDIHSSKGFDPFLIKFLPDGYW